MIPLYILGLLLRYGPQHGYQIGKLPTVYYHLEKLEAAGFLTASCEKDGARPEKTVYQVSGAGERTFGALLKSTLETEYRPTFSLDGAFYFAEYCGGEALVQNLSAHTTQLQREMSIISSHRDETLRCMPASARVCADLIFTHHLAHYRAELAWTQEAMEQLKQAQTSDERTRD